MTSLKRWLFREESARIIPVLDRPFLIVLRCLYIGSYVALRVILRLCLGQKKRNTFLRRKGIKFNYAFDFIPAFLIIRTLRRFAGLTNPYLLKIFVPKYGFSAYCPANQNDVANLTVREDDILDRFTVHEGDIVVDIGAHIGHYTLIASKLAGASGKIISIEAHPRNFQLLERNIELNKLTNVMALNSAVYSREEIVKLYCPSEDPGDALYYSLFPKRFGPAGFLVTQAHTLDNILITYQISPDKVKWIKIDVEGAELEVLKGSTAILSKSNNISILVEIHRIDPEKTLYQPVVDFLLSYGFTIQDEWLHQGGEGHIIFRKG